MAGFGNQRKNCIDLAARRQTHEIHGYRFVGLLVIQSCTVLTISLMTRELCVSDQLAEIILSARYTLNLRNYLSYPVLSQIEITQRTAILLPISVMYVNQPTQTLEPANGNYCCDKQNQLYYFPHHNVLIFYFDAYVSPFHSLFFTDIFVCRPRFLSEMTPGRKATKPN